MGCEWSERTATRGNLIERAEKTASGRAETSGNEGYETNSPARRRDGFFRTARDRINQRASRELDTSRGLLFARRRRNFGFSSA